MLGILVAQGCAVLIAAVAAFTDWRTGHIPNWLTLPAIVIAPIGLGLGYGLQAFLESAGGIVICGLVPYLMFRKGAMAGGDVKLFAAVGALTGVFVGIEAQFLAMIVAAVYALGVLAWRGKLFRTLGNSLFLGLNPILPKKWRREVSPELMNRIRLGAPVFVGTAIAVALRNPMLWSVG